MSVRDFTVEVIRHPVATAAVLPSSRRLARAMVNPLPFRGARVVVEFGPGTGVMTEELLARLPGDAKLLAFESNPRFAARLRHRCADPRLIVVNSHAQRIGDLLSELRLDRIDGVVSTLGLSLMPPQARCEIFQGLLPFLSDDAVVTQVQYRHRRGVEPFLRRYFHCVTHETVWRNVPPAYSFICRGPDRSRAVSPHQPRKPGFLPLLTYLPAEPICTGCEQPLPGEWETGNVTGIEQWR